MGTQYDRYCSVCLGGQPIATLNGNPDQALRVRFKLELGSTQAARNAHVIITNLEANHAAALTQQVSSSKPLLQVDAGYVDSPGTIYAGDTFWCVNGRESPTDTTLQIFSQCSGIANDYGTISQSLQKGSTPQDHYNAFVQALQPFGVTAGYTPTDGRMSQPQYPRGVAFAGMVKHYLGTLASSLGCTWYFDIDGSLNLLPAGGNIPGAVTVLNSSTGLIGMPTRTFAGILARCFINPQIKIGSQVQIDQSLIQGLVPGLDMSGQPQTTVAPTIAADGIYNVNHMDITGDTRGNDWYMDLCCIAANQAGTPGAYAINAGAGQGEVPSASNQQ